MKTPLQQAIKDAPAGTEFAMHLLWDTNNTRRGWVDLTRKHAKEYADRCAREGLTVPHQVPTPGSKVFWIG